MECELAKRQAPGGHVVCAGRWKRNRQKLGHAAAHKATSGQAHKVRHGQKETSLFRERIQTSTAGLQIKKNKLMPLVEGKSISKTIYKSPQPLLYFLSLLFVSDYQEPYLNSHSFLQPSTLDWRDGYARVFIRATGRFFQVPKD